MTLLVGQQLATGLLPLRPGLASREVHLVHVFVRVALGQASLRVALFFLPPLRHIHTRFIWGRWRPQFRRDAVCLYVVAERVAR